MRQAMPPPRFNRNLEGSIDELFEVILFSFNLISNEKSKNVT
jgi:hypothetical protein